MKFCEKQNGLTVLILTSVLMTGCSLKKDVDDMISTTKNMDETTQSMDETTKEVKEVSENLFLAGRDAMSREKQEDVLKTLHEYIDAEEDAFFGGWLTTEKRFTNVLQAAVEYHGAHSFQFYKARGLDSREYREELYAMAAEVFFLDIKRWVHDSYDVQASGRIWEVLSALSVGMSKVYFQQHVIAKEKGIEELSLYDIIAESLRLKERYEAGKKVPVYVEKVLANEQEARYMLELRHNYFLALVLSGISDLEDAHFAGISNLDHLLHKAGYLYSPWEVDLTEYNAAQFKIWNEWLGKAEATRDVLMDIGADIEFNDSIVKIYNKMRIVNVHGSQLFRFDAQRVAKDVVDGGKGVFEIGPRPSRSLLLEQYRHKRAVYV
jgi:hypothetical protein